MTVQGGPKLTELEAKYAARTARRNRNEGG